MIECPGSEVRPGSFLLAPNRKRGVIFGHCLKISPGDQDLNPRWLRTSVERPCVGGVLRPGAGYSSSGVLVSGPLFLIFTAHLQVLQHEPAVKEQLFALFVVPVFSQLKHLKRGIFCWCVQRADVSSLSKGATSHQLQMFPSLAAVVPPQRLAAPDRLKNGSIRFRKTL